MGHYKYTFSVTISTVLFGGRGNRAARVCSILLRSSDDRISLIITRRTGHVSCVSHVRAAGNPELFTFPPYTGGR